MIFQKYITAHRGKYLVFCANREHLNEMLDKASEHFGKIDAHPHIYKALYSDPDSEEAFQAFKNDTSEHLKLLYSIDMLNEGVHVDDIDGVILFRPTISPIIYKQQIGRALCVGKNKDAVILDIVNNIASLYSISAVQEEMDEIIEIFRDGGSGEEIVHEHFQIIDEQRDCRRMFEQLEQTLLSSWDTMYVQARQYFQQNGNLLPTASYVTEDGYQLGQWLITQRTTQKRGVLSQTRIQKLDAIGMDWRGRSERLWENAYQKANLFFRNHGHLSVTAKDDAALSAWLVSQRRRKREGTLPEEQVHRLTQIGMIWDFEDVWASRLKALQEYEKAHGNLRVPTSYISSSGFHLGHWISSQRFKHRNRQLKEDKVQLLSEIGMIWQRERKPTDLIHSVEQVAL